MDEKIRRHVYISGRVQGIFFRENTRQKAQSLYLTGWVKNLPDGRVEAVFEGKPEDVQRMVEWVKEGPALAEVDNVEIKEEEFRDEFDNFQVLY